MRHNVIKYYFRIQAEYDNVIKFGISNKDWTVDESILLSNEENKFQKCNNDPSRRITTSIPHC